MNAMIKKERKERIKRIMGVVSLATLIPFFSKDVYTKERFTQMEKIAKSEQVRKMTKEELEIIRKRVENFNKEIKKELSKQKNLKNFQNYDPVVETNQLYLPKEAKLLYKQTSNFGEEENLQWYIGGELSKKRDIKNVQLGGEIGNFGIKAFIDPINNKRKINFKASKGKSSIEILVGNEKLSQGKLKTSIPKIAEVNMLYDFNNERFNYSISKNCGGVNLKIAQQFGKELVIGSLNVNYSLDKIGIPGKVKINYVVNNYKNQKKKDKLGIVLQEKIGILNLEGKIEKTPLGLVPSITGKMNYSWN